MPQFPTKQSDISALAGQIIAGSKLHHSDFPKINWSSLNTLHMYYKYTRNQQANKRTQAKLAIRAKKTALNNLKSIMKNCLKKSQVDTSDSPDKLALIGWDVKTTTTMSANFIGQPIEFKLTARDGNTLTFEWQKPVSGGSINCYILQRREFNNLTGLFEKWEIAGICYDCCIRIANQPKNIKLEYNIIAANRIGQSAPSNTVTVVL
jgi:hypothetical protein